MYAAYLGDAELTEALLKAGADPAVENDYGTTAIQEAAIIGANEVMAPAA